MFVHLYLLILLIEEWHVYSTVTHYTLYTQLLLVWFQWDYEHLSIVFLLCVFAPCIHVIVGPHF